MPTKKKDTDAVDLYAADVVDGRVVAGPGIRAACKRHIADRGRVGKRGFPFVFDPARADNVQGFFRDVLKLSVGETEGQPFELLPWQAFYIRSIFGWVHKATGLRRFKSAYLECGKGGGKSPLHAGIGLYLLVADGENSPQIYVIARDAEQAKVVFQDAVFMLEASHMLSTVLKKYGGSNPMNITYEQGNGYMRRLATQREGKGASGPRPSGVILDEIHEFDTDAMIELMSKGVKARTQPLIMMGTNSGTSRTSIGWDYHAQALAVVTGEKKNDELFAMVFNGDADDDPLNDDGVWIKTNPSLPVIPGYAYLKSEAVKAKSMPSKRNTTLRLNFCQWTDALSSWIDQDQLDRCEVDQLEESELKDLPLVIGVDLSAKKDLTAAAMVWRKGDGLFARVHFWTPQDGLLEKEMQDQVPYSAWRDAGNIFTSPGRTVEYSNVVSWFVDTMERYNLVAACYDQWKIDQFIREFTDSPIDVYSGDEDLKLRVKQGLPFYAHPQGAFKKKIAKSKRHGETDKRMLENGLTESLWMPASIEHFENAVLNDNLKIEKNPCLRWNILSAVTVTDPSNNRRFEKKKSTGRIDGCVALAMAVGLHMAYPEGGRKLVEPRVILI